MSQPTFWTDEREEMLVLLWPTHSASEIAEIFGPMVTRNSVIGKAHRLGLETKRNPAAVSEYAAYRYGARQ